MDEETPAAILAKDRQETMRTELLAIEAVHQALCKLPPSARKRVIYWAVSWCKTEDPGSLDDDHRF